MIKIGADTVKLTLTVTMSASASISHSSVSWVLAYISTWQKYQFQLNTPYIMRHSGVHCRSCIIVHSRLMSQMHCCTLKTTVSDVLLLYIADYCLTCIVVHGRLVYCLTWHALLYTADYCLTCIVVHGRLLSHMHCCTLQKTIVSHALLYIYFRRLSHMCCCCIAEWAVWSMLSVRPAVWNSGVSRGEVQQEDLKTEWRLCKLLRFCQVLLLPRCTESQSRSQQELENWITTLQGGTRTDETDRQTDKQTELTLTQTHTCTHTHMQTHTYTLHTHTYTHAHTHTCTHIHAHKHACMHVLT